MAKVIQHNDLITPKVLEPTIEQFDILIARGKELNGVWLESLKITANGVVGKSGKTLKELQDISNGYESTALAAKKIAETNLIIAKTETEKARAMKITNAESEKAARAAKKEADAYGRLSKQYSEAARNAKNLAIEYGRFSKEATAARNAANKLGDQLKKLDASVGQHQRNVGNYRSAMEGLPGPIGNAISSVTQFGRSMMGLLKNPVALFITAIVAALYGLFRAFISTDEGGLKFKILMEQISAVLDVLRERAAKVAQGILDFLSGDWAAASKNFNDAAQGVTEQLEKNIAAAEKYAKAIEDIEDAEMGYISQRAKNRNEVAKLLFDASDQNKSTEERLAAMRKANAIEREESEKQVEFAEKRFEAQLEKEATYRGISIQKLREYILADDKEQERLLANDAALKDSQNILADDRQKELEELYEKLINADTSYYEQNKRNHSRLTGLEKDLNDELKRIYDQRLKDNLDMINRDKKKKEDDDKRNQTAYDKEMERQQKIKEFMFKLRDQEAEDQLQHTKDLAAQLTAIAVEFDKAEDERDQRKLDAIDRNIEAHKTRADFLREQAAQGNKDAEASIALEEKRAAEQELKKERIAERARKRELAMTALNTLNSKIQSGDPNALGATIRDLTLLGTALASIPGFLHGTDDTGEGGNLDSNGGMLSILHKKEKVFNRKDSAKIGYDVPNSEVADTYQKVKQGLLVDITRVPAIHAGVAANPQFAEMNEQIKELVAIEKKRPDITLYFDEVRKYLVEVKTTNNKVEQNHYPGGGLW